MQVSGQASAIQKPVFSAAIKPQPLNPTHTKANQTPATALQTPDHFEGHTASPWPLTPPGPLSASLLAQAKAARPAEIAQMIQNMPVSTLSLWSPDELRAPHQIIRAALALALKDGNIEVSEALELRGLLLQLPRAEREKYTPQLNQLKLSGEVAPILRSLDLNRAEYAKDFSAQEFALLDSPEFKLIFPNFALLNRSEQRQVLNELKVFLNHFPSLLSELNNLANDNYGPGFQYFFVTAETNKLFDTVLPKGTSGVIMPGANVIKDPLLGLAARKISLRMLDRGGMLRNYIPKGVFSHEFGHVIHLNLLNDDQRDTIKNLYAQAWQNDKKTSGKEGFISNYAKTNPYEYFADSLETYLTGDKSQLQRKDPAMFGFLAKLMAPGKTYAKADGNLFNDPERIHLTASSQGGRILGGVSVSRESDLFSVRHFEGGITQELQVLGGDQSALVRGSIGVKAAWKPGDAPVGAYITGGAVAQAGVLGAKVSAGVGGYAGVGVDYKNFNAEVRQNWMAGVNTPPATEVRVGYRWEF
jgi:hypothetical protein